MSAQTDDGAVRAARDLDLALGLAGVGRRHEMLAPVLDPLDRPAEQAGGERNEEILGRELAANPEAAADIVLDQFDGVRVDPEQRGGPGADRERHLGRPPYRQPVAGFVPLGDDSARLQRNPAMAVHRETLAAHVFGGREGARRIAAPGNVGDGLAVAVLEQRYVGRLRLASVGDRRQRLDVEFDQGERVLGDGRAVGDHQGDGLADEAHLGLGDDRLGKRLERRHRREPDRNERHRAHFACDLGGGNDRVNAGHGTRARAVDGPDAAMGDGAAQDRPVQHAVA